MENNEVKNFKQDNRFIEWENKWRSNELFLDSIISSDFAKEIVNKNYKILLWFQNKNYCITLRLNEDGGHICEINFLMGDYNIFADTVKNGRISKVEIIDYDIIE